MTTVKASCPICGEVELTPDAIALALCTNAKRATYRFNCPVCADDITKAADERVCSLLLSARVPTSYWTLPAEALEPKAGPPISYDDLLDFHLALAATDYLVAEATR